MGGNKSKPVVTEVVETARETIARRKLIENPVQHPNISPLSSNSNDKDNNTSTDPFISNLLKDNNNVKKQVTPPPPTNSRHHEIEADIIDQISSWNMITTHYDKV
jgi:hypothetical protein